MKQTYFFFWICLHPELKQPKSYMRKKKDLQKFYTVDLTP